MSVRLTFIVNGKAVLYQPQLPHSAQHPFDIFHILKIVGVDPDPIPRPAALVRGENFRGASKRALQRVRSGHLPKRSTGCTEKNIHLPPTTFVHFARAMIFFSSHIRSWSILRETNPGFYRGRCLAGFLGGPYTRQET